MEKTRECLVFLYLAFAAGLAGCHDISVEGGLELGVGDFDPKAPEGWPLAIGDRDIVPGGMAGGVAWQFETWKGNCCINWISGVPYTAKWRSEDPEDVFGWQIYEGHVEATPTDRWRQRYDLSWKPEEPVEIPPMIEIDGQVYPKRNHSWPLKIKGPLKWNGSLPNERRNQN